MISRKKGFTLVELVITIAISAIVMVLVSSIFFYSLKTVNMNEAKSELQQDGENIQGVLLNIGTQSQGLSYLELSGGTPFHYILPTDPVYNTSTYDTVQAYLGAEGLKSNIIRGYTPVRNFVISLLKGQNIDSLPAGTISNNDDYLQYKFTFDDNLKELYYSIVKQQYRTSPTIGYIEIQIPGKEHVVLSRNVESINIKPINWTTMASGAISGDNFLYKMNAAKFIIQMQKTKGFYKADYSQDAIIEFRNIDKTS